MISRAAIATLALVLCAPARAGEPVPEPSIDALFSQWTTGTPGCAVGVSDDGRIVLQKAYGMANLEHGVPNRTDTIFEAGSVAKQFTAAAVLLLAQDGKLSLDDPARKHVPELPEYAASITVRQLLEHTSGLRDWGGVEWIAGWPRGTRVYTHAHVLDILSRQGALNFAPGTRWSYSNSGYNLAAVIVARLSGEPFSEFTRKRIFEPLGMSRTSWRDDYRRIVKDRAVAYEEQDGRYVIDMPNENVHGNGGLLTTVGDLMIWNGNFTAPLIGGDDFAHAQQTPGRLSNGNEHGYAMGLGIDRYKGLVEISHSGTTGSYRAFLARYPDQQLSIALLCNAGNSMPRETVHAIADLYLAGAIKQEAAATPFTLSDAELDAFAGMYRDVERGNVARLERKGDKLQVDGNAEFTALSPRRFTDGEGSFVEFDDRGRAHVDVDNGWTEIYERVDPATPTAGELESLAGRYTSSEAETTFVARVRDGTLELTQRPDTIYRLIPLYRDAFESDIGTIIFRRDAAGRPIALSVVQDRVWDLRFRNESAPAKRILVFGDSNTWGWIPVEGGFPTSRYDAAIRWPGIAQSALGEVYEIIEEGLSGRTTDQSDPTVPEIPGAGLDGSAYLPAAVASHLPLDLVVLMLGTNDLKSSFDRTPDEIAAGMRKLVELVQAMDRAAWTHYPAPKVLVIAPPPLVETEKFPGEVFANGIEKSRELAARYAAIAKAEGVEFLDAGAITSADGIDGLHLSAEAHRRIGLAMAEKLKRLLE